MPRLPLALSVPHAGLAIPPEVAGNLLLTPDEIAADGDVGADAIYTPLARHVAAFHKAGIARAFVDPNRAADDFGKDGVVKTHTCWDIPIYREPLGQATIQGMLAHYYRPYHDTLTGFSHNSAILMGIDCHTMATHGPPVGPDPGSRRPFICLGNARHTSCPKAWLEDLAELLYQEFGVDIALNTPFAGGYITRHYGRHKPWLQLEWSRTLEPDPAEKSAGLLRALQAWCGSRA